VTSLRGLFQCLGLVKLNFIEHYLLQQSPLLHEYFDPDEVPLLARIPYKVMKNSVYLLQYFFLFLVLFKIYVLLKLNFNLGNGNFYWT
jgi:hypothetical protein